MMDFMKACDIARDKFIKQEYKDGFCDICDIGDRWLFIGRSLDKGVAEYGNCPVTIDKETGKVDEFPFSLVENYDLYYESEGIEIPPQYFIKD